jgi:ketosteroid isomerase-like protein
MFQDDVETLRGAYEAFNERGVEAILEHLAPRFQVRDRESSPDRETRYGRAGVKELFASYMEAFDAFRLEPDEFIDAGGQVLVTLHQLARGKESGARVVSRIAHVWKMEEGAAVRLQIFADKEAAVEALRAEGADLT